MKQSSFEASLYVHVDLGFAYPVSSAHNWTGLTEEPEVKELLAPADLYLIGQRAEVRCANIMLNNRSYPPTITLDLVEMGSLNLVANVELTLHYISQEHDSFLELGWYDKHADKSGPCQSFKVHYGTESRWYTAERLLFEYFRGDESIKIDRLTVIPNYNILYVGKATEQHIIDRVKVHGKLIEVLANARAIVPNATPADEIVVIPICLIDAPMAQAQSLESVQAQGATSQVNIPPRAIMLDAEKALIRALDPVYNKQKYKQYPFSKDGLYSYNIQTLSYRIVAPCMLTGQANSVGCFFHERAPYTLMQVDRQQGLTLRKVEP